MNTIDALEILVDWCRGWRMDFRSIMLPEDVKNLEQAEKLAKKHIGILKRRETLGHKPTRSPYEPVGLGAGRKAKKTAYEPRHIRSGK